MARHASPSWWVIGGLIVLAMTVIYFGDWLSLKGEITGALAGALIGGAGVVLGGTLERTDARKGGELEREALRGKLKTLIAAELVGVALGYVTAFEFMSGSLDALQNGAPSQSEIDLSRYTPAPLSWATDFRSESLVLTERQLDILVTLGINMAVTRKSLGELGTSGRSLNLLNAPALKNGIAHDIGVLAEAFEEFAPTRKLQFPGKDPELASVYLRRLIKG